MSRGPVTIATPSEHSQLTNPGGNSTNTTIALPQPSASTPGQLAVGGKAGLAANGDGVIPWGDGGAEGNSGLKFCLFGLGADTTLGLVNVYGWESTVISSSNVRLWFPTLLGSFSFELDSGMPGVLNSLVPATNYFATTITLIAGDSGVSVEVISPGHGADIAHVVMSTKGARYIEFKYGLDGSSTSLNGLWKRM